MATIRDKLGHGCFEAGHDSVPRVSTPVRRDAPGVIRDQAVAFAVGRQSRTDFAFGVSVAANDGVSERPEKTALSTISDGRRTSLRGAWSSHYQREGELVVTTWRRGTE